jgi:signal peptidase II
MILVPLISVAAVILIIYLFLNSETADRRTNWALTLILAGAAGNLYDRAVYGYVVDFLDFYMGTYHWPAFNVADTCITIGAGLLLLGTLRGTARQREEAESA